MNFIQKQKEWSGRRQQWLLKCSIQKKILAIKKAYECHAGTAQRSSALSPTYSSSTFLSLATSRWLKNRKSVCTKWSFQKNIILPSGNKQCKGFLKQRFCTNLSCLIATDGWMKKEQHKQWFNTYWKGTVAATESSVPLHRAPSVFLRGLLSNYSRSSTCLAREIWQNHSLRWSSWDLTFIYKT